MNAKTQEAIKIHGENLLKTFPNATEQNPIALCKKLRRIETVAHRNAESWCNGDIDGDQYERAKNRCLSRVEALLKPGDVPVFVDSDARGYALKIHDRYIRENRIEIYRDMGGYGIIAPDLTA